MFDTLLNKLSPYSLLIKVVGILLIIGSLVGYYYWSQSKINELKADVNAAQITIVKQQDISTKKKVVEKKAAEILVEISKAPPTSDGPVAPILRDTIRQLQDLDKKRRGITE
jgi:hypothetical protein